MRCSQMQMTRLPDASAFRQQPPYVICRGHGSEELAGTLETSAQEVRSYRADTDAGRVPREMNSTAAETISMPSRRNQLARHCRKNRDLRVEHNILLSNHTVQIGRVRQASCLVRAGDRHCVSKLYASLNANQAALRVARFHAFQGHKSQWDGTRFYSLSMANSCASRVRALAADAREHEAPFAWERATRATPIPRWESMPFANPG